VITFFASVSVLRRAREHFEPPCSLIWLNLFDLRISILPFRSPSFVTSCIASIFEVDREMKLVQPTPLQIWNRLHFESIAKNLFSPFFCHGKPHK
jgi:hypothetical protein